jgi:hypothetical protein
MTGHVGEVYPGDLSQYTHSRKSSASCTRVATGTHSTEDRTAVNAGRSIDAVPQNIALALAKELRDCPSCSVRYEERRIYSGSEEREAEAKAAPSAAAE